MAAEMTPVFSAEDMINLGIKEFYIKITIDGETFDPFSAETLNVLPPTHDYLKKEIIRQSREKYALPLEEVKKKLEEEEVIKKTGKIETKKEEKEEKDSDPEPLV